MPLSSEITKSFVTVARDYWRLQADISALAAILETARTLQQPPKQWKELFLRARETPGYREIAEKFEPQLAKLEKAAEENEVIEILRQFPQSKFPN